MRIGYDGKRAAKNLTGLGNYSRWLVGDLSKQYPENEYLIYTAAVKDAPRVKNFFSLDNIHLRLPLSNNFLWRRMGILKDLIKDRVKIYHGLSQELPFAIQHTKIKSVVTIHDLIFIKFPEHYSWIDTKIYKWKTTSACAIAHKIIAISENTKKDIIDYYKVSPDKIEVIYQSCDEHFKTILPTNELNSIKAKYNLPEKYILYVGTIESRKNLAVLVKAMAEINTDYKLVVLGKKKSYFSKIVAPIIKKLSLDNRILFFENLEFQDLPGVYQNAKLFVLPSYYEGFGIPIIEALYSKIPVIAATGSCLEEAGGPGSKYFKPDDVEELIATIKSVIDDPVLSSKMIENGTQYVEKFDTKKLCTQVMNCYKSII